MTPDTQPGPLQQLSDLLIAMPIVALAILGWRRGFFATTLLALTILAGFFVGMAGAVRLAPAISSVFGAADPMTVEAFILGFLLVLSGLEVAIGRVVPEDAMGFRPAIDQTIGCIMGILSGFMLTGVMLIAWSMAPVPSAWRIEGPGLRVDPGSSMLGVFTMGFAGDDRERVLRRYERSDWREDAAQPDVPADDPSDRSTPDEPQPDQSPDGPAFSPEPNSESSAAFPSSVPISRYSGS